MSDIEFQIEEIRDQDGVIRRCGSLPLSRPKTNFVTAYPVYESAQPMYTQAEVKRLLQDPNRTKRRDVFGDRWIMDQKNHGSCNGFAGAGALSKARYLRGVQDGLLLSGAYLYSLINGGRDNGSALEDGLRAVEQRGICSASLVGWDQIYPRQYNKAEADADAANHKGLKCFAVMTKEGFESAVAAGFVVIVAVHAGNNFSRVNSAGQIGVDNGMGNHAVHVDDAVVIDGEINYDLCNSWNLNWAKRGRGYVTWKHFAQTFNNHMFYAIPSTNER